MNQFDWFVWVVLAMCKQLENLKRDRLKCNRINGWDSNGLSRSSSSLSGNKDHQYECVSVHVSPDLGERVMLSGDHAVLDEVFPETGHSALEPSAGRPAVSWTPVDSRHLVRFPLNGYCKLNSVQAITRLLNAGFIVAASTGGGVHGQQFSEYLFVRKMSNWSLSNANAPNNYYQYIGCVQIWIDTVRCPRSMYCDTLK